MQDFVFLLITFSTVVIDLFVIFFFNEGVKMLYEKDRTWIFLFLIWVVVLFLQTVLYSWLPGRVGLQFTMSEIVLEDGALFRNMGYIIMAHAVGFILSVLKYLWKVIKKEEKFYGKFLLLELAITGAVALIASQLMKSEYVIHFKGGESAAKAVFVIMAVVGGGAVLFGFIKDRQEKKSGKKDAASQNPSKEDLLRYDQIVEEKHRLDGLGDYASQIPLLIEAVGLNVDVTRKAKIWNYMGAAYQEIGSEEKAAECFHNAEKTDPGHPSSYINLAFYHADRKEYALALKYADTAIKKAKIRKLTLGPFYARYALIAGLSGDRKKANEYLQLAKDNGGDPEYIASIQNRW